MGSFNWAMLLVLRKLIQNESEASDGLCMNGWAHGILPWNADYVANTILVDIQYL
jgi:hypothetical protein